MKFSKKLKQLRIQNNLKQSDIAELCNVTRSAVSNWENSRRFPEIESVTVLSKVFNVSVEELLGTDQATVTLHELEKDVAKTNNKISRKVPIFLAILWIVVFSLLLILIAPVVKDKYIRYINRNTIDMIDANSIEKVELVLTYYKEAVTVTFEEYPTTYLSEEYETDNGKVYILNNLNFIDIFEEGYWGLDDYFDITIYIKLKNSTIKPVSDKNIILINKDFYYIITKQSEYKVYVDASYQLKFYIINNICYLEVFLLE